MSFKQQGKTNLNIATYLNDKNMDKIRQMSKQELASVIINRLYYGVFLLAKELVTTNEETKDSHIEFWIKINEYMIDNRIDKKHDAYILNDFMTDISRLKEMRVVYDYKNQAYLNKNSIEQEIKECFSLKDKICKALSQYDIN